MRSVTRRTFFFSLGINLERAIGAVWASAPKKIQREMLKVIFETVFVDVLGKRLVCVKPYPQFAPLFRAGHLGHPVV